MASDLNPSGAAVSQEKDEQHTAKTVKQFKTIVFFDLETTGLPSDIGPSNCQITEISMVAMDRKEFWQCSDSELKDIRVMHKLSMCVKPRSDITDEAANITGLNNSNLTDQTAFNKNTATSIISFLSHLPKPVCLLAHNGYKFDFPLLKSELKRLSTELPSDILIADTFIAFRTNGIDETPSKTPLEKRKKTRISLSLRNLYLHFFNKEPTGAHTSEGDCWTLAKVCHKIKETTLPWLESHAKSMASIEPMWGYKIREKVSTFIGEEVNRPNRFQARIYAALKTAFI